ncbi:cell wall metabolism sensor histidine kinase WalK [Arthrobacter oryzae]|nr:HAMP domain-containing sensor histidine kinase [Arthrobacter oryzae]
MNKQRVIRASNFYLTALDLRALIFLCQLPVTLMVAAYAAVSPDGWSGLLESGRGQWSLGLQATLLLASFLIPWQRLAPSAPLVLPVLDLIAIGLTADHSGGLQDSALLLVLPVIWIAASRLNTAASLSISFLGAFLPRLPWILEGGAGTVPDRVAEAVLVPLMMLAVAFVIRCVRITSADLAQDRDGIRPAGHEDAAETTEDLLPTVAHELRTPLTSIIGNLDLVLAEAEDLPARTVRRLEVAERNAERLLALVADLLLSSNSALHVLPRRTDLAAIVATSLSSAQAHALKGQVTLSTDLAAPLWAQVDPLRFSQALDNLVSNAIKYSPDGGSVTVSASIANGWVRIHVKDTGMGMRYADATRVFTRFYRSPTVRETTIPGAGLGLAITKTIVERHGGSISCRSVPGRGSTFTVKLPAFVPQTT